MKKTLFFFTTMLLFVGAVLAQTTATRTLETESSTVSIISQTSRAVVYSEGFENTTGIALPTGWKTEQNGTLSPWMTIDSKEALPGVTNPVPAYSGDRSMARSWNASGVDAWAISSGFALKENVSYTIIFWFRAPGYPQFSEFDDFEVKIGQTQTATGLTHTLYSNIENIVNPWTKAQCLFKPATSGTYYLGFHDLNKGEEGIYIYIDEIEVAECTCCPVTDFVIEYTNDCKANLTWNAPSKGNNVYKVLRNGVEIATVETESYTDTDFEATIGHTWAIQVVCDQELSIESSVTKDKCDDPDCSKLARFLSVNYTEDCKAAELEWFPPIEVLWDNTASPEMYVVHSARWLLEAYSREIAADDFTVPAGETWYITEVRTSGTSVINSGTYDTPHFFGVEIYKDKDGVPGDQIWEDPYLVPIGGNMSNGAPIIVLSETVKLEAGKYWVAIYGSYDALFDDSYHYYITLCSQDNGSPLCVLNESNGFEWEPETGDMTSLYFRLHGNKTSAEEKYNIYRDGERIASNVAAHSFADNTFNPLTKHRWAVVIACPQGGESAPILVYKNECTTENVTEPENSSLILFPNPSSNSITIQAESAFNKVEVFNFLGQTVLTQLNTQIYLTTLNVSNLNSGIYFVRIETENGVTVRKFVKQ